MPYKNKRHKSTRIKKLDKMATITSTRKIIEFLKAQSNFVTPTFIHKNTNLGYPAVKEILGFLKEQDLVTDVNDGRLYLVGLKKSGDMICQQYPPKQ